MSKAKDLIYINDPIKGVKSELQVVFNEASGTATLQGKYGVSSSGYSYNLASVEEKNGAVHLNLEINPPNGAALAVMSSLSIKEDFAVSKKTTDVYVHLFEPLPYPEILTDPEAKKEFATLRCQTGAKPA
jgi:hypothetical protein